MIKVMQIISDTNIGGAGKVVLNYLANMDRDNFDVSVVLPVGSALLEHIRPFGVRIYEVNGIADKSFDIGAVKELCEVIHREDPDIVHTHGAFSGRIAAKKCGKKVVFTRHSAFPLSEKLRRFPLKNIYGALNMHYADKMIAVSPVCREYLTDAGVHPDMVEVVINGVESMQRTDAAAQSALKGNLGIPEGVFVFGVAARLEKYKGQHYAVEAARILKSRGFDFRLVIAGTGSAEEDIRSLIGEMGVSDKVVMTGFFADMPALFSILDAQVNASYVEATSLSLLEGMSMALPSVVTDCGGNPLIIKDGEMGFVCPMHSPQALADAMEKLLRDPCAAAKMGAAALSEFEKNYTGAVFAKNTEAVYRNMLEVKYGK